MTTGCRILGLGAFLPKHQVGREAFPHSAGTDVAQFRHHADGTEGSIPMGVAAAKAALNNAALSAHEIDAAIIFSGMPDYEYPKDGNAIMHAIGATNASCWNLDTACASFITGLEAARLRIEAGGARRVLVVTVMNWVNRGVDRTGDFSAVGDGAAAVIVERRESDRGSFLGIREATYGEHFGYLELPSPFVGKAGPKSGPAVFQFGADPAHGRFLMSGCLEPAKKLLQETQTDPMTVDWMIAHQPGTRLPKIWARALGIPSDRILSTYENCANMSAVNIPMTLTRYAGGSVVTGGSDPFAGQREGEPTIRRGQKLLFFAPGAGLHVAAMLWTW